MVFFSPLGPGWSEGENIERGRDVRTVSECWMGYPRSMLLTIAVSRFVNVTKVLCNLCVIFNI